MPRWRRRAATWRVGWPPTARNTGCPAQWKNWIKNFTKVSAAHHRADGQKIGAVAATTKKRGVLGVVLDKTAVVQSVAPDSGAAKAGLKPGDAIIRLDGQPIKERTDVAAIISQKATGDKVRSDFYVRDGREQSVEVVLYGAPSSAGAGPSPSPAGTSSDLKLPAPHFQELSGKDRPAIEALSDRKCYDTEYGWIFCSSEEEAKPIADDLRTAAAAFLRYFGEVPGRGAVVTMGTEAILPAQELEKAGAQWVMPWLSEKGIEASLEKQIVAQLKAQGIPEALMPPVLAQAKQQMKAQFDGTVRTLHPLQHEVGHIWFIRTFWSRKSLLGTDRSISGHGHYSGFAHDWLNETAAILLENDKMTAGRHRQFADTAKATPSPLRPLAEFFTMEHPSAAAMAAKEPKDRIKPGQIDFSIGTGRTTADKAADATVLGFYTQCRGFIDFLIGRTKDEQIFRKIAQAEAKGGDMASWLAANGAKSGCLEQWKNWIKNFTKVSAAHHRADGREYGAVAATTKKRGVLGVVLDDDGRSPIGSAGHRRRQGRLEAGRCHRSHRRPADQAAHGRCRDRVEEGRRRQDSRDFRSRRQGAGRRRDAWRRRRPRPVLCRRPPRFANLSAASSSTQGFSEKLRRYRALSRDVSKALADKDYARAADLYRQQAELMATGYRLTAAAPTTALPVCWPIWIERTRP